jgi:predicted dehydrogenase
VLAEQVTGTTGIDMALYGTMRFPNDVVGQFEASFAAPRRQRLEIVGEDAILTAFSPFRVDWPGELRLTRDDEHEAVPVPVVNSYRLELENLADAIDGAAPALLGRDDALGQARAIEGLYRAAAAGEAVTLA